MGTSDSYRLNEMYNLDLRKEFHKVTEEAIAKAQDLRLNSKGIGMIFVVY